jgi:Stress responsive A/B Barrel Domain
MIRHIVMWKVKKSTDKTTALKTLQTVLNDLKKNINEIRDLEVGLNFTSDGDASCDIVLNTTFASVEDLKRYQKHPEHLKALEIIRSLTFEKRVVDYQRPA